MELSLKYYRTTAFVAVVILMSTGITWFVDSVVIHISNESVRLPTNAAIIGLLLLAYDRWGWKLPVLKLLVKVPDISGRYKGQLLFIRESVEQSKECAIEIVQTASFIRVYMYTDNANQDSTYSKSISEELFCEDGHFKLVYLYNNFGNHHKKLNSHEGFNVLRIYPGTQKKNIMKGYYFTNRNPQTQGDIRVKFRSVKLKHKF